jgi:uncharacterized cofD-like protein
VIEGETKIVESRSRIKRLSLSCEDCKPLPETLEAIKQSDLITIGPGSLYTSIIPNLLVEGIADAISQSRGVKVYICNIMTQPGETEGFTVEDHLGKLFEYSPHLDLDYVIVNSTPITSTLREKYLADGAVQVRFGYRAREAVAADSHVRVSVDGQSKPLTVALGDLLNEDMLVRHDPHKLAGLLLRIHRVELMRLLLEAHEAERGAALYPAPAQ